MKFTKCKISKKKIPIVFSYGKMPIANNFANKTNNKDFYEMQIAFNEENGLFQLVNAPKPKKLFNSNYAFLSSTSKHMQNHFKKIALEIKKKFKRKNLKILEIGCNDGIFLKNFIKYNHLGIEPSKNVCEISKSKGLNVINSFFDLNLIKEKNLFNKFDIIFAANVICHIPNIKNLFRNIELALNDNGVFIFEEPYLGDVIEKTSYDQIYDEHYYLFSINSIKNIIKNTNLEIFDSKRVSTHGGSMRYYLQKKGSRKVTKNLNRNLLFENKIKITSIQTIKKFANKCKISKNKMINTIKKLKKNNLNIFGYGATSKSTTIINFCKLNSLQIDGIFDTSPTKIGGFAPGTTIPIIDYKEFDKIKPSVCILFAWNHYKEIFKKEQGKKIKWIVHINKKFLANKNAKIISPKI